MDGGFFGREAEGLGFESAWFSEHVVAPVEVTRSVSPFFENGQVPGFTDPLIGMARASAVTSSIKLGTSVILVAEHQPIRLAKALATLDRSSGGRIVLGVGSGWLEEEAVLMGVDFEHRGTQVGEAVRALKALWSGEAVEFHGRYYDFPPVRSLPRPAQRPGVPVYLGGVAPAVLKRVVAYGDGWAPEKVTPEDVRERRRELDELAREAGRDPAGLPITVFGKPPEPELVGEYLAAGADRVVVGSGVAGPEAEVAEAMRQAAKDVLPLAQRDY
ncbi:MAG: TIGR03619 family F420-dependent LLM class oxidoreductase [Proteobacteria bacterium]|nr:TIGR03619 family F420-dependent LLM class oxidoreductase [Pseudomonadota bacterium]